jgi:hypothetical protein
MYYRDEGHEEYEYGNGGRLHFAGWGLSFPHIGVTSH